MEHKSSNKARVSSLQFKSTEEIDAFLSTFSSKTRNDNLLKALCYGVCGFMEEASITMLKHSEEEAKIAEREMAEANCRPADEVRNQDLAEPAQLILRDLADSNVNHL